MNKEFNKYMEEWRNFRKKPEILFSSRAEDHINCDAYEKIVSLGEKAIPLIIREMKKGEFFLIYALERITKSKPYSNLEVESMSEQDKAKKWLEWWGNYENKMP